MRALDLSDQSVCWVSLGGRDPLGGESRWIDGGMV
jgi:hypothetical protein